MKISVVTIVYNDFFGLKLSRQSVLEQRKQPYEHIVVDGNSQDDTLSPLTYFDKEPEIVISEEDTGIYHAMNKGVKLASGDFVIFLNAGDTFFNNNFLQELSSFKLDTNVIYFGNCFLIRPNQPGKITQPRKLIFFDSLPFNHQSCLTPTRYLKEHQFDEALKILGDLKFYKKLFSDYVPFVHLNIVVAQYTMNGISSVPSLLYLKEVWMLNREQSFFRKLFFSVKYVSKYIFYKVG